VQEKIVEVLDAVRLVDLAKHLLQGKQEEQTKAQTNEVQGKKQWRLAASAVGV
jgi:hypothetical protein